jgi:hypothetical protein
MMSRSRWAVLALTSSCLFPDLSGLESDASVDSSSDAPPSDASVDATDASDASSDGDGGPTAFCANVDASHVVLCDDFDDSDASTFSNWTGTAGSCARDHDAAVTAPFSLIATAPPSLDASAPVVQARIRRTFTQAVTHVTHTFDARIDQSDTGGNQALLNMLTVTSGGIDVQYRLLATSQALSYEVHIPNGQDAASASSEFALTPWTLGSWHRVVADITTSSVPSTLTVWVDGVVVVGPNAAATVATFGAGQSIEIQAGIYYADTPENGWVVHVDDVLLQLQ